MSSLNCWSLYNFLDHYLFMGLKDYVQLQQSEIWRTPTWRAMNLRICFLPQFYELKPRIWHFISQTKIIFHGAHSSHPFCSFACSQLQFFRIWNIDRQKTLHDCNSCYFWRVILGSAMITKYRDVGLDAAGGWGSPEDQQSLLRCSLSKTRDWVMVEWWRRCFWLS